VSGEPLTITVDDREITLEPGKPVELQSRRNNLPVDLGA